MKITIMAIAGLIMVLAAVVDARAEQIITTTTATVVEPTQVVVVSESDSREFEGEIISVDYPGNQIMVREPNGRERRVDIKQGMISNLKVNDYVEVQLMMDNKEAKMVKKVKEARLIEGTIIVLNTDAQQLVLQDANGQSHTVLMTPGNINQFRTGEHVRVYAISNDRPVRYIRVIT